jgi:ribosome-associated protein
MPVGAACIETELEEEFLAVGGPGGQNVNKTATGVRLRFCIPRSKCLTDAEKERALSALAPRLSADGSLIILAQEHRSQVRNREEARTRLYALLRRAVARQRPRIPTKPTKASRERRLEDKSRRSQVKRTRARSLSD